MESTCQLRDLFQPGTADPLVLDCRNEAQYLQRRLAGAVNIPLSGLNNRCFLLPDKATPFAVVVPSSAQYTVTADVSQHGIVLQDGSQAVFLKGATSLQEFLGSRWSSISWLQDGEDLWAAAAQLSVLEEGTPADPQQLARPCLFAPSGLLASCINEIEAALLAPLHKQQQQQGGTCAVLRALDVGCGSGRDVAWLARRQPVSAATPQNGNGVQQEQQQDGACGLTQQQSGCDGQQALSQGPSSQQQQLQQQLPSLQQQQQQQNDAVCWHVTGVDEWLGALERAADLAEAMSLGPDRVALVHARICPETGSIQPLPAAGKSRLIQSSSSSGCEARQGSSGPCSESCVQPAAVLDGQQCFDLIICCRFLVRALLPRLAEMLNPGGFILYSTFVDLPGVRAFGRPSGADHLLQPGELAAQCFGPAQGFEVLLDSIVHTQDGRELCWYMARKH